VAYKLDLSATSSVHPVFHVSQLKKAVGNNIQVSDSLPFELTEFQVPEKILQQHLINRGIKYVIQVLVKWLSLPVSLATWEDMEALRQYFLRAPACPQAGSSRGEDVRHRVPETGNEDTGAAERRGIEEGNSGPVGLQARMPNKCVMGNEWLV
jgi:hypothetical protein